MGVIETFPEGRLSHIVIICTHCLQNPASGRKHLIKQQQTSQQNKQRQATGCRLPLFSYFLLRLAHSLVAIIEMSASINLYLSVIRLSLCSSRFDGKHPLVVTRKTPCVITPFDTKTPRLIKPSVAKKNERIAKFATSRYLISNQ